eukprot:CAMPEP_0176026664 /NCGR_PEP_ID=MMETSP0120_2-20121206/13064_1 /TAXON_ID=160619 /ORGANISM="Kryptoperidinium foliaceum, Strain CCMP 1326" /LENGTH=136 /DNA_ID=CAMNT_0017359861 /DNA_START=54 /DNA_END=465 /DNA_ORIENTATION=+
MNSNSGGNAKSDDDVGPRDKVFSVVGSCALVEAEPVSGPLNVDGESLDSRDWMELAATGAVSPKELEHSFLPMTIEFEIGYGVMDGSVYPVSSDEESNSQVWSDCSSESSFTTEDSDMSSMSSDETSQCEFSMDYS